MPDRLIFYNHFGAGDVFESREFIKEYMKKIPAKEYLYAHGKNPIILKDISKLGFTEVTPLMDGMKPFIRHDNSLYINTWIGRDGKYVLPGIGCTVEYLYLMHNEILGMIGEEPLSKTPEDYIPDIDYSFYPGTNSVSKFCNENTGRKVLISNGPVQSNQAFNFDFDPSIKMLADRYPDILFILTSGSTIQKNNVLFTSDIIEKVEGFDLNEISLLSTYCDTQIGRNSGPHVFSQVKRNWFDSNKVSLSFTYQRTGSHFVLTDELPMRKFWSPAVETDEVFYVMGESVGLDWK